VLSLAGSLGRTVMNQRVFRAGSILLSMVSILFLFAVSVRAQGDGATVYKTKCAMCHGPDGSASTPMAKSLKIRDFRLPEVQKQTNAELTQALANIHTLSGLIPICAGCKKIRDDRGYWDQVESYIAKHSDAKFTHGICPECSRKYYPGIEYPKQPGT